MVFEPMVAMWITFAIIAVAIGMFAWNRFPMELVSAGIIAALLILFAVMGAEQAVPGSPITDRTLLAGFADPALIAILALLVVGQGMVQTGALEAPARWLVSFGITRAKLIIACCLVAVMFFSALLNNTPVVVIFIPILASLSEKVELGSSAVMMPLSFAAILGGNITLIGSSTNLLVAGRVEEAGGSIGFFEFSTPGLILAGVGFIYILVVAPKLLKNRAGIAGTLVGASGKQFVVQIEVTPGSSLDGQVAVAGMFPGMPNLTVSMVQKGNRALLPPYDDITLEPGDAVIVAATRPALTEVLAKSPNLLRWVLAAPDEEDDESVAKAGEEHILAEAVVAPASRLDGRTLKQVAFRSQTDCIVLGIQRRARMYRTAMDNIRMEAGDVLLVIGKRDDVLNLRSNRDVLLLEWSATEFALNNRSRRALAIFTSVVALSATQILPITIAAMAGATLMIGAGCLNIRQAARAVDRRVVMIVGASLAMGAALQGTGGAIYIADLVVGALIDAPLPVILSGFFLLVAILTNVLSNNATAVLFTPIALSIADRLDVDPMAFIVGVIFAANCSFATPMGYQTNLLVMGPGHYQFSDYMKAGAPLIILMWITFSLVAPWYYGFY